MTELGPALASQAGEQRLALEAVLAERFGIALSAYSPHLVASLLAELPESLGPQDPEILATILSTCSIGETTFLRHPEQFGVLDELLRKGDVSSPAARDLVLWSAGCASGEEAYSLAAVALATRGPGARVLATDVNPAAIARARAGRYRLWSLRGLDPEKLPGWLRVQGLEVEVAPELRALVEPRILNLATDPYPDAVDVAFCRNVLIYFHPNAVRHFYRCLARSLRPGGLLFIGYVDPPPEDLSCWREEHVGTTRYFRRLASLHASPEPPPRAPAPRRPGVGTPRRRLAREAVEAPAREEALPAPPFAQELATARGLAAQLRFREALVVLERLRAEDPLAVEPHVLGAMIADEAGWTEEALTAARRACFLAPDALVGRFLLASCLRNAGEAGLARRRLEEVREALAAEPDLTAALPHGEGLTGHQLRRIIDVQLGS